MPYGRQSVDAADVAAVTAVLTGDWLTTGPAVAEFEAGLVRRLGAAHAVACSSGTAALHLATLALGLGPGDGVVTPAITFVATANAARFVGAEVVFADVDPDSGLMGVDQLREAVNQCRDRPIKAVMPVHMAGQCADLAAIQELAAARGAALVEDACHALGTTYADAPDREFAVGACRHSDMALFSFHPVKSMTMGEGGAVLTNDPALAKRARGLRNHGLVHDSQAFQNPDLAFDGDGEPNPWYREMIEPGYNYRASDIHCALGTSQLAKLDRFVDRRRRLVARYDERLHDLAPLVRPLRRVPGCRPGWHLYVVLIDFAAAGVERSQVMRRLRDRGIGSQVHYVPVHLQPYYRKRYGPQRLPGAEAYYRRALTLPLFADMEDGDVDRVVAALAAALGTG